MQIKGQMTMTKLGLLLFGLTVIWILCSRAELQLPQRFQDDIIERMGGHLFDNQKLKLALTIKNGQSQQKKEKALIQMDQHLSQSYKLDQKQQRTICIVVRDFQKLDNGDSDYLTIKSIIKQNYGKYHIIYLSEQNDSSKDKIESYLIKNQIADNKYSFVNAKTDTIGALFLASEKCSKDGIMVMIEDQQQFITSNALKVINAVFNYKDIELTWATSLYANDKLGFSFPYSDKIKQSKLFRKFPFPANDVIAFKNDLFQNQKQSFIQFRLVNPLWMPQSYGYTLVQRARNFKYIPQILTIKNNKSIGIRAKRSQIEKKIENLIRKDESIIPVLQNLEKYQN